MPDFSPTEYAVPGFVLLVVIEMIWARRLRREAYEPRDTLTSLARQDYPGSVEVVVIDDGTVAHDGAPDAAIAAYRELVS